MTDEELKVIWKASNERMQSINLHSIQLNNMNEQIKKFEKTIRRRNNIEILAAIGIIACFGFYASIKPEPLAKIGAILTMLYAFNVIYQLKKTASMQPSFDIMSSLKEQLIDYQMYILAEQKLLKNVFYWYLLPMLPGLVLFLIGTGITPIQAVAYFGVFVPLGFTFVYYINRKTVERKFRPLLEDIDEILKSFEETN